MELDIFINDKMKVLIIISKHQVETPEARFCPLSQQEIADLLPCSKLKINNIIKELVDEQYVEMKRKRGRYTLTSKAVELLNKYELDKEK